MSETRYTFCRICEALCGLEVEVEAGRVLDVRPDRAHVATDGFCCIKGLRQHRLYASPDRVRAPQRREGERWESVGWDRALGEIGAKLKQLRRDHGPDSIATYVGTAAGFSVLHPVFAQGFMTGLGSRGMYASATQDCSSKFAVARAMYGFPFIQPFPDLERTRLLIVVGANPLVSKWSFLQVPHPLRRLRAIVERGGRVVFVDPRRTESARAVGEHLFIRPGTDVFFYLAFLNALLELGGVDRARLGQCEGFDALEPLARPWTPERCEQATRVPAARLRELAAAYARAGGAALYCSTGVNMGPRGALAFWLQEAINAVSGNLDRAGGTLVGRGILDFPAFGRRTGTLMREDLSRVGGLPSVNDAFPGGVLADEILTPGPRQVRALIVTGGNPLVTMAGAGRLREAFSQLELLVTVDIFRNETGSLAHYVLPATSPLERPDLPFIFPLMLGLQLKPYLQATPAVLEPDGEQRDEASIYLDLCRASGVSLFGSRIAQGLLRLASRWRAWRRGKRWAEVPQEWLLSLLLRLARQPGFSRLLASPHGRLRPPHEPGSFLGKRVLTDSGRVELAPAHLVAEAERCLETDFERELARGGELRLVTKRAVTTHNSWTHNLEEFVGHGRTNHLYLHPEDAARIGLSEGELADVSTATGSVRLPVRLLAELMPGTVALPHGWGHQHASGLSIASQTRGVNVNLLAAAGPGAVDPISGMSQLTALPVEVRRAAGEQDPRSWSGIPANEAPEREVG